jgi:ribosome-associated protein
MLMDLVKLEQETTCDYVHASGPGGQNVNKVATAVQLRFNVRQSEALGDEAKTRLEKLVRKRISNEGVLIIEAKRYRSQEKNREDAKKRLISLIEKAMMPITERKPSKPGKGATLARLEEKRRHAAKKQNRKVSTGWND